MQGPLFSEIWPILPPVGGAYVAIDFVLDGATYGGQQRCCFFSKDGHLQQCLPCFHWGALSSDGSDPAPLLPSIVVYCTVPKLLGIGDSLLTFALIALSMSLYFGATYVCVDRM